MQSLVTFVSHRMPNRCRSNCFTFLTDGQAFIRLVGVCRGSLNFMLFLMLSSQPWKEMQSFNNSEFRQTLYFTNSISSCKIVDQKGRESWGNSRDDKWGERGLRLNSEMFTGVMSRLLWGSKDRLWDNEVTSWMKQGNLVRYTNNMILVKPLCYALNVRFSVS